MKADYLIVGQGIAGSVMSLTLEAMGKSVLIMNDPALSASSVVAAGVYNPFNFRRSTPTGHAQRACEAAKKFYAAAEQITGSKFHSSKNILRLFGNEQERAEWTAYLQQDVHAFAAPASTLSGKIMAPYGCGTVEGGGVVQTRVFLESVRTYFSNRGYYLHEKMNSSLVKPGEEDVSYDNRIFVKQLIFCEGHFANANPFFDARVIAPTKGEVLHVKITDFNMQEIVNGPVYLAPLGNDVYVCGATFNPGKNDEELTSSGKDELIAKLKQITNLPFEVVGHFAGVRPAGRDRKPVLGRSRNHRNLSIFNGFGSKGVLMSPFMAQILADHLENGAELPPEMNITRFKVY